MYTFQLDDNEIILRKALANLQCEENHFSGAFYLTTTRVVFIGYLVDATQKFIEQAALKHIKEIRSEKTFGLIPNVIRISTQDGRELKILIKNRNEWVAAIETQKNQLAD